MNNNSTTLRDILTQYRKDNNISDDVWYGICKHYTRGATPNFDTIRYYLSPYYLKLPKELTTDEMIKNEMLNFIQEYSA